ncbi:MAG: Gx transporter family protein [Erysipelotrichaceae bacterium]|nr:Gx transporter family protein [Erysipelotrichaceae bacterium]
MRNKKIATSALMIALAMILSFVESQIPSFFPIPGIKLGLANIAVIFALYRLSIKDAIVVSLIRVVVVSTLFGTSLTLAYSLSGAVLSLLIMVLLKKLDRFSIVGVSVAGGISHNIGQIIMAIILMHNSVISYYLPFLIISGIVTGVVIGLVSAKIVERVKI